MYINDFDKYKKDIIKDKIKDKNSSSCSDSLAFAIKNDIFPICDLNFKLLWKFEANFKINKKYISDVYINLQNHYDTKTKISFSNIEIDSETWGIGQNNKIDVLRYFYLSGKFNAYQDYDFWEKLFENESFDENFYMVITRKFNLSELKN